LEFCFIGCGREKLGGSIVLSVVTGSAGMAGDFVFPALLKNSKEVNDATRMYYMRCSNKGSKKADNV